MTSNLNRKQNELNNAINNAKSTTGEASAAWHRIACNVQGDIVNLTTNPAARNREFFKLLEMSAR